MPDARRLTIDLGVMLALAVALALLGPFGMYALPFAARLIYWLLLALPGYALFMPAMVLATRTAYRLDLPVQALWAAACALAAVPMTLIIWCANFVLGLPYAWPRFEQLAGTYAHVLIVAGIACTLFWFGSAARRATVARTVRADVEPPEPPEPPEPLAAPEPRASEPSVPSVPEPRLLDRLPPHLGRDLIALEMEDHYVRAHTPRGSALLLMRMRDAVPELDGIDGAQVHRSWWVARGAVEDVRRDGRNYRLRLAGGIEAPVARSMVAPLQDLGWLG
ncbi:LytTR family DNA-binding domain-containing protein [Sphingomonas sanxanigenens]|uniref:HTH LytTR-type domain-containing protein n=1 Tax=Sphingomonas sanxanigenens DSM 19645 = NX02 TaxID=1123269 RepID=W0ACW9_9SPHN|nr:LytTR family DNA-binding domain-containing protein [Sphingomonas sanxanigenens]AHE54936.1 hypothetical protein NX02_16285 [Sphingomonas sanxanigenens DSM 19645 = NX02]